MRTAVAFLLLAAWSAVNSYYIYLPSSRPAPAQPEPVCAQAASAVRICLASKPGTTFPR